MATNHRTPRAAVVAAILTLLVSVLACSVTTPATTPAGLTTQFTVQANQGWTDTGIQIESGDVVDIQRCSGVWTYWPEQIAPFDADGDPQTYVCATVQEAAQCVEPLPEANKGALIARVGETTPIYIGNHSAFQAATTGVLELSMNDSALASDYADNEGFVVVEITVTSEP